VDLASSQFMTIPLNGSFTDYFNILVFMSVAFGISLLLVLLSFLRGPKRPDKQKLSPYECGFEAFSDARMKFDVRFYLVAILFIIFDLEIAFLFPWAVSLKDIGLYGFFSMLVFLGILMVGFVYEWRKGALEWE
jgi:NADH-quinone oxidoreductase subunit A